MINNTCSLWINSDLVSEWMALTCEKLLPKRAQKHVVSSLTMADSGASSSCSWPDNVPVEQSLPWVECQCLSQALPVIACRGAFPNPAEDPARLQIVVALVSTFAIVQDLQKQNAQRMMLCGGPLLQAGAAAWKGMLTMAPLLKDHLKVVECTYCFPCLSRAPCPTSELSRAKTQPSRPSPVAEFPAKKSATSHPPLKSDLLLPALPELAFDPPQPDLKPYCLSFCPSPRDAPVFR
mmetsp:Transcript_147704/g.261209  ORF Transcript_147704/g.261209 Transcript_147704/m.261209 type:complete len:236 (+) Transcript_147704:3-710(+)